MKQPSLPENQLPSSHGSAAAEQLPRSSANSEPPHIPDHELLRRIGRGSYGEVWLARNILGGWRAVKIVYRTSFDHDRPFEREFAGIQKFEPISRTHESQVDILHVGRGDGYFYYVMELADTAAPPAASNQRSVISEPVSESGGHTVEGSPNTDPLITDYSPKTLKHLLKENGRLPFEDCLQISLSLATALAHLHKHGLVHRDIKPSNIIFVNGRAKLADIGLVTSVDATRSFVGTEGYLAPEGPGTPQADIYSLGKVLYEMSTGQDRRHFPALPPDVAQCSHQQQMSELNAVVVKACQLDPKLRYQSAEALQADLARLQAGGSVRRKRTMERRWAVGKKLGLVAAALALLISSPVLVKLLKHGKTPNPEVVRLYELGQWHHQQLTDESHRKAIECLNQALKIDPNYVPAYTALFRIYNWGSSGSEKLAKIKPIASTLLGLAPNLAESHHASSLCNYLEGDWRAAEEEIQRSLRLNPNYAPGHGFYCYYLSLLGRVEEAKVHGKRAQELEPTSRIEATVAGYPFMTARQYDQAIGQFRRALELDPNFALAHRWIGKALEAKGEHLAALEEFEKCAILSGVEKTKAQRRFDKMRQAFNSSGPRGYWLTVLELDAEAASEDPTVAEQDRWPLEGVYAQLGEKERALDLLERDFEASGGDDWLRFDPIYEPLRDEPRFKELLKKAGLEKSRPIK